MLAVPSDTFQCPSSILSMLSAVRPCSLSDLNRVYSSKNFAADASERNTRRTSSSLVMRRVQSQLPRRRFPENRAAEIDEAQQVPIAVYRQAGLMQTRGVLHKARAT